MQGAAYDAVAFTVQNDLGTDDVCLLLVDLAVCMTLRLGQLWTRNAVQRALSEADTSA